VEQGRIASTDSLPQVMQDQAPKTVHGGLAYNEDLQDRPVSIWQA